MSQTTPPTLPQLQAGASAILGILRNMPSFSRCSITVIGGLALWLNMPTGRNTLDIDFAISTNDAPGPVKTALLRLPNTPFVQFADMFYYRAPNGLLIKVDICPLDLMPYQPPSLTMINQIPNGFVPHLARADLLAFKVSSCGQRAEVYKRAVDIRDILALLRHFGPFVWSPDQINAINAGLSGVVRASVHNEAWWRAQLGI